MTRALYAAAGSVGVLAAHLSNTGAAWYDWLALIVVSTVVGVLAPRRGAPMPRVVRGECFVCGAPAVARWRSAGQVRLDLGACPEHIGEVGRLVRAQLEEPRVYDQEAEEGEEW